MEILKYTEYAKNHCKDTKVCGRPIIKSQATQFALVEMATEIKIGRTFIDKLIADHINFMIFSKFDEYRIKRGISIF